MVLNTQSGVPMLAPNRIPSACGNVRMPALTRPTAATLVALEDCRYDVAVEVEDVEPEGEIGRLEFPAMTVAEVELRGSIELEQRAIDWLFGSWLPQSGYLPSDQPCFEAWIGRPFVHGLQHFELFAQLPVTRG